MRFVALDGWRGLCALAVAIFHLHANSHLYSLGIIRSSYLFVDFFFALSGFVITSAYLGRIGTATDGAGFLIRRFGRLFPLHFVATAAFVLVEFGRLVAYWRGIETQAVPFDGETSLGALAANLAMVHSLGIYDHTTWNFPSWSISVEFYTYVVFALAMALSARTGTVGRIALFTLLAASGAILTVRLSTNGMDVTYDYGFFRCVEGFFIGAIGEWLFSLTLSPRFGRMSRALATVLEIATAALAIAFVSVAERTPMSFLAPFVFLPAIIVFAGQRGLLSAALSSRPMRAIGDWSYSIYMIHAFLAVNVIGRLIGLARKLLPFDIGRVTDPKEDLIFDFGSPYWGDLLIVIYLALVLALAALAYRYVETPGRRAFNRLAGRLATHRSGLADQPAE